MSYRRHYGYVTGGVGDYFVQSGRVVMLGFGFGTGLLSFIQL